MWRGSGGVGEEKRCGMKEVEGWSGSGVAWGCQ